MKNSVLLFVSKRIRDFRNSRGMTAKELSILIGISQQQLSRYERGVNNIDVNIIYRLSVIFQCDINCFFSDENTSLPDENEPEIISFNKYSRDTLAIVNYSD